MKLRQIARKHRREAAKKTTLTLASGLLFSLAAGNTWADCTGGGGVYTCSGALSGPQTILNLANPVLNVNIDSSTSGVVTAGTAIEVLNVTGAATITSAGSFSSTAGNGLHIVNFSNDLFTITQNSGAMGSSVNAGLYFQNEGGSDINITQGSSGTFTGSEYGIHVYNKTGDTLAGSVYITTAGYIYGENSAGIYVWDPGTILDGNSIIITSSSRYPVRPCF